MVWDKSSQDWLFWPLKCNTFLVWALKCPNKPIFHSQIEEKKNIKHLFFIKKKNQFDKIQGEKIEF